ncbi:MAG TPA: phosphatidylglycerol lysyltransferase domain-containing protein [Actinocrinis sp.]|uniref:bifunctional lysylphosphatidylglycerol flippase/synthetase MprF n=1 Tax=Actinocrinis sp. TaxID=1920516 RepID=UPI002DDDA84B|nr:phosphatidylglycerol lysyltransferase domain-containing protein [Actinocrinis sp.]HEV2342752.1 phosphatidylglycerol lysyltransferase domain-containing protein [Actinocrinis sp.]
MLLSSRGRAPAWPFAALFALCGTILLVYAKVDGVGWLDRTTLTVCGTTPTGSHAVLLGLVLLTLAHGLARRRQVAWILGLALVLWSALTEVESLLVGSPADPWRLIPLLLAATALVRSRDRFVVSPDPHRLRQAVAVTGASGVTLLLLGGGSLFAERGRFAAPLSTTDLGREFFAAVAANGGRVDFNGPSWLLHGLSLASGLALIAVLATLTAAAPPPRPADSADRAAMRALVSHRDADTLAPFALRYDKSYVFEPRGRAAIGYRVLAGMAVAAGDPIGARSAWPAAIEAFLAEAERRGWRPAVLGAGPRARELWAAQGMQGFGIGDEAVIDVASFSTSGRAMRNVRQAVRRTENAGIWVSVVPEPELSPELSVQLRRIHRAWLGRGTPRHPRPDADMIPQGREHGFAMNLDAMAEGRHPDSLFVIAFAADGYAVSFQRYLLAAETGSGPVLTLDVMPRHRIAPNGVNERLIVATIEYAAARDYKTVSLNFAAFRTILEAHRLATGAPGAPPRPGFWPRMTRRAVHLLDPLIQVESLYHFNAKFRPGWLPRSVLVASWLDLPLFGVAALGLEFGLPYDRRRSRIAGPQLDATLRPQAETDPGSASGTVSSGATTDQANWSAVQRHSSRPS